jgi:hypothetical protein
MEQQYNNVVNSIKNAISRYNYPNDDDEHWAFCEEISNINCPQFQSINCTKCGNYRIDWIDDKDRQLDDFKSRFNKNKRLLCFCYKHVINK